MAQAARKWNRSRGSAEDRRRAELAKIHIAKKDLGLDDGTYRAMLHAVAGVESAAELTACGRRDVLEHLKSAGFASKTARPKYKGRPHNMDGLLSRDMQLRKIEALLTVGGKSWAYADGIARRICKVDKVAWVKTDQLYKIITALRMQAQREGWDLSGE